MGSREKQTGRFWEAITSAVPSTFLMIAPNLKNKIFVGCIVKRQWNAARIVRILRRQMLKNEKKDQWENLAEKEKENKKKDGLSDNILHMLVWSIYCKHWSCDIEQK